MIIDDLFNAAQSGNLERVKELVEQGANVNAKKIDGKTVLQYAAQSNNPELVEWLKDHGAK